MKDFTWGLMDAHALIDERLKGGSDKIGQYFDRVTDTYMEFYQGSYRKNEPLTTFILVMTPGFSQLHEVRDTITIP